MRSTRYLPRPRPPPGRRIMRAKVGILISGRGSNMASLVEASKAPDSPYEVVLVASNVTDAPGLEFAKANGVPTWAQTHIGMKRAEFDELVDGVLRLAKVEYVALAGYMRLLSPGFVQKWAGRMINIHPSLLPAYKGLDTHQRVLDAGEAKHGCSVHIVTEELDNGEIVAQAEVPILPSDDAHSLAARVLVEEHKLYPAALAKLVRGK